MPALSKIKLPNKTVTVDFGDVQIQVTYDPNVITPRLEEDMETAKQRGESATKQFLALLTKWVVDWDLTDDADAKLPITVDTFADMPESVLTPIIKALNADMRPNATNS